MDMAETMRIPPGAGYAMESETQRSGWSLRLAPACGSIVRRKEFLYASVSAVILAVAYIYPLYAKTPMGGVQLCWFHRLTGLPCLLCGMTRSLADAARLNIGESFYYHLLGPFLFLFLAVLLPGSLALLATNRRLELSMPQGTGRKLGWFLLALLIAAWVLKLVAFGVNV